MEEEIKDAVLIDEKGNEDTQEVDQFAIVTGEKPTLDVMIKNWTEDGDLDVSSQEGDVRLILAKNKKFYQRGLLEISIGDKKAVIQMDALLSCIFSTYETQNPYQTYNPSKPLVQAYGILKETSVEESKEAPAHTNKEIIEMSFKDELEKKGPDTKKVKLLLAIEGIDELQEKVEA